MMRSSIRILRSPLVVLCLCVLVYKATAASGDWPEPRQNAHLTGIQPLPGSMTSAPELLARFDLGRSQPSVSAVTLPDGSVVGLTLVAGRLLCFEQSGALRWESHPAGLNYSAIVATEDLNGDGVSEVLLKAGRPAEPYGAAAMVSLEDGSLIWRYDVDPMSYAWYLYADHYLPDRPEKQLIVIMHGYPPDEENGYIALFGFDGDSGLPVQQWRYDFDAYTCFPSLLRTDLDRDGVKELAVETHSRMWFFDAVTGEMKHFAQWDVSPANMRSYGLVKFVDLDKDGREDFLCIANFAQHHEVLLNVDGKMEKAWSYGWPESVTTGKVVTTWPEPPDVDVDGDGGFEIVVSMYNSEDDNAWLTRIYDAVTGELKYRIPGVVAVSTADVDGDGVWEIFGNASTDPTQTKVDGAGLYAIAGGAVEKLWEDIAATAVKSDRSGTLRVDKDGNRLALRAGPDNTFALEPWAKAPKPEKPAFRELPAIVGPAMPKLLAADLAGEPGNDVLLYQDPTARILVMNADILEVRHEFTSSSIPVIADLIGDGMNEVVTTSVGPEHRPIVEAKTYTSGEEVVWRTELPPTDRTGLPASRLAYVRTGRFTGGENSDLYFWAGSPMVRSAMLNGKTGELIWDKGEVPDMERYWGASVNLASVWDFNGDGKDDLVFTNPDYYCVADGPTGEPLLGPLHPPQIFDQPSQGLYTLPAILSQAAGDPVVSLVAGHYFQGALSLRAKPMWYELPPAGQARCAEEGFMVLPDGTWLMGFGRQNGNFACINVSDGSVRWELPVEASCTDVATCDIDGDGRQEFIFGTSHGALYAVRDGGDHPEVLWQAPLSAGAGSPIVADVNSDARSDIIVPTVDGYVNVYVALNRK
jgi:outer membrane protein assembly factor BamB